MVESSAVSKIFELKVFIAMFVFNFTGAFYYMVNSFLPLFIQDLGFRVSDIYLIDVFFEALLYVFNPILFFVIFYFIYRGEMFLNRIASTLISLVLGAIIGYWLGGFAAVPLLVGAGQELETLLSSFVSAITYNLPFAPSSILLGFGALAFADINRKWKNALAIEKSEVQRPVGMAVLSIVYVVFGVFTAAVTPLLLSYQVLLQIYARNIMLATMLIFVFAIIGFGQILIGVGLYYREKWGWFSAFISSVTIVSILAAHLVVYDRIANWAVLSLVLGLAVGVVVLIYLLGSNVRECFGLVNPTSGQQS